MLSPSSAVCLLLHAPGSVVEELAVVNKPEDFDKAVGGDTVEQQAPRLANTVSRRDEASC